MGAAADKYLAGGPPAIQGTQKQRAPIGAPEQYFTERGLPAPSFKDGDEMLPLSWEPDKRRTLQAQMQALGLYGDEEYRRGGWDKKSQAAFKEVLEYANGRGLSTWEDAVAGLAQDLDTYGIRPKESERRALTISVTNPEAVRETVRQTALRLTGRRLDPADEERMIAGFRAQETAYQQAAFQAQGGETGEAGGGMVTEPMSLETYAQSAVQGADPMGVARRRRLQAFDILTKAVESPISAPRIGPGGGVTQ